MRTDHHRVTGLKRDQRLIDRGRSRVGSRKDRGDHAHRRPELDDPLLGKLAQDAGGAHSAHPRRKDFSRQHVLRILAGRVAISRFLHGQLSQSLGMGARSSGHSFDDHVDLFLRKSAVAAPRRVRLLDLRADLLDGDQVGILQHAARLAGYFSPGPFAFLGAPGRIFSTSLCGAGMTCTATSSPTRRAAAAPASVAALTAPTSPRTVTVTNPAPMYSLPISTTFAVFTIASAASIAPTSPLVSTIPRASMTSYATTGAALPN